AMFDADQKKEFAKAAPHVYFLRKWFLDTKEGKQATKFYAQLEGDKAFLQAYRAAESATETALRKVRQVAEQKRQRRAKVKEFKAQADKLYHTFGQRFRSYKLYRQLITEYPGSPEADAARAILKKHKLRWKEPSGGKK
ncbi:MAG: hypothetical protein ACE5JG_03370, partial [Planctomycetota bacterium]